MVTWERNPSQIVSSVWKLIFGMDNWNRQESIWLQAGGFRGLKISSGPGFSFYRLDCFNSASVSFSGMLSQCGNWNPNWNPTNLPFTLAKEHLSPPVQCRLSEWHLAGPNVVTNSVTLMENLKIWSAQSCSSHSYLRNWRKSHINSMTE